MSQVQPTPAVKKVLIIVDWTHITSEVSRLLEEVKNLFESYSAEDAPALPYKIEVQEVRLSHSNFIPKLLYLLGASSFPQVVLNGKSLGGPDEVFKKRDSGELKELLTSDPKTDQIALLEAFLTTEKIPPPYDQWLPIKTQPNAARDHHLFGKFLIDDRPPHIPKTETRQLGWLSKAVENTNWFMTAVVKQSTNPDELNDSKLSPSGLAAIDKDVTDYKGFRKNWLYLEENCAITLEGDQIVLKDPFFDTVKASIPYAQIESVFVLAENWLLFNSSGNTKNYVLCEEELLDRFITTLAYKAKKPIQFCVQVSHAPPPKKIFRVTIDVLVETGAHTNGVPQIIEDLISQIEKNYLDVEGLFRVTGIQSICQTLEASYDNGEKIDLNNYKVHEMASLIKTWFRSLPSTLIPEMVMPDFIALKEHLKDENEMLIRVKRIVEKLPKWNIPVLRRLLSFLAKIHEHSNVNKMTSSNLARVFAPNILPSTNFATIKHGDVINNTLDFLITHYEQVMPVA
eukprot:TRINITY_DN593_c0_g1_i1.p1 TRINITY_DN593_c0_g1~~TRINITY_DN593_c0_g1_i1.p1  ORF type:complete len:513 (+),score=121.31 TRINITY_DN593_c0_g1_i1:21-1559(+)